ncbi:unnamed protein product [Effrenium voratum]|uniref:Uncharacterized protein n=2 Tax=Effrenium voratum TaxID=2562239 RepID=A0AA36MTS2_9DINO|nr:unnamed protein product [Effrenium voratum]CAJ1444633.1 unnamed protein product [Effrenium voratum]
MRINAAFWIAALQANVVLCGKMMSFRHADTAPDHRRVLQVKLKADAFVDPKTTTGEVGGVILESANGTCLSCDSDAVCSSPDVAAYKGESTQKVCRKTVAAGEKWSWTVSPSSAYDIMIEIPLSKLGGDTDFKVSVTSSVDASGKNSAEQAGRQVTNWVATSVMGTQEVSTGRWLRSAWSKVAVNLNGDFRFALVGKLPSPLTSDANKSKELFAEHCIRPDNISSYIITEQSLTRGAMQVTAKCKAAFKGTPVVTECDGDLSAYKLSGCVAELCTQPADLTAYNVLETHLGRESFAVTATCKDGYAGSPTATVCAKDGNAYSVSGCKATTTTVTTTSTSTSTTTLTHTSTTTTTATSTTTSTSTTSTSTSTHTTTVTETTTQTTTATTTTVTRTTTATATMTETATSTTTITTSTETTTSIETTTTLVKKCTDTEVNGYKVTATSLEVENFQATAECAAGYEGSATVKVCDAQDMPFKLSGCAEQVCQTPADSTGYILTEVSTKVRNFEVQAKCAPLFHGTPTATACLKHSQAYDVAGCDPDACSSPDTTGYLVTESDLNLRSFVVTADCAAGFVGAAKVSKCDQDGDAFKLEGCTRTTTSTTTTTNTLTSTTTMTATTTGTTTSTSTSTTSITSTLTITGTTTSTSTITETSTGTTTSTVTQTSTSTSTTTTSTSTTTTTISTTSTSTITASTTTTSTSTLTTTSTLTVTSTSTGTTTITSTTTTSTSTTTTITGTTTSTTSTSTGTTTSTSTSTTTTSTSTSTTSTSTITSTTTTSTSTITSTTVTSTSTITSTTTTSTSTHTSTTTTSTSTTTTTTATSTLTSTTTTKTTTTTSTSTTATSTITSTTTTSTSTTTMFAACLAPRDASRYKGFVVEEHDLRKFSFDVTVRCSAGYEGTPSATACTRDQESYSLTGCEPAKSCKSAGKSAGYVLTETDLTLSKFSVKAQCEEGYEGTPTVTACADDAEAYTVSGCEQVKVCLAPTTDAKPYVVTESVLKQKGFSVTAKCADGYFGTATVAVCTAHKAPYELSGCEPQRTCLGNADSTGYTILESNLIASKFSVTATCAKGYEGTATVTACVADMKPYSLSGCELAKVCLPPNAAESYIVTESDLKRSSFSVAAQCAKGYEGTAAVSVCAGHKAPYTLSGCEPIKTCLATADSAGYTIVESDLTVSKFSVTATCAKGYEGTPKVTACVEDMRPYTLSGCEPVKVCVAPTTDTTKPYIVTESDLTRSSFSVAVQCAKGYHGTAAVAVCGGHETPYTLSGCEPERNCVGPSATTEYSVVESNLLASKFSVTATCAKGYEGTPTVTVCAEDGKPYTLSGCEPVKTCLAHADAKGYAIDESDLTISKFSVTATCEKGYEGTATVKACAEDGAPYTISGCEPVKICLANPDAAGYTVVESDLSINKFSVTATCAKGYEGTTTVTVCAEDGKPYTLSGCEPVKTCLAHADAKGYTVVESDLTINKFSVTATCAKGYEGTTTVKACAEDGKPYTISGCEPVKICLANPDAAGYTVVEADLTMNKFSVTATCAKGYEGAPTVTACGGDGKPYTLSGCEPVKVCVASSDVTGYQVTETSLKMGSFDVAVQCAAGFEGTASATACTAHAQPYQLSGCVRAKVCVAPKDAAAYKVTEGNLQKSQFKVDVSCAAGYRQISAPTAVACEDDGQPYRLSGCSA